MAVAYQNAVHSRPFGIRLDSRQQSARIEPKPQTVPVQILLPIFPPIAGSHFHFVLKSISKKQNLTGWLSDSHPYVNAAMMRVATVFGCRRAYQCCGRAKEKAKRC